MTRPFRDYDELRALLEALCEETISAEQVRRLEEMILAHPEAEAYYVQYLSLHADLDRRFVTVPSPAGQSLRDRLVAGPVPAGRTGRRIRPLIWGGLGLTGLAAGLLVVLAWWPRHTPERPAPEGPSERIDGTVAILLRAPGAEWGECDFPIRAGAPLPPGWLRLKSGLAQIEFYCGATVILQGPAALRLISRTEAFCARGKLRATVPPQAQGFAVGTPKLDLVDRGTDFGVQVEAGGQTDVHVFQGQVDLYDPGSDHWKPRQELTTGRGLRLGDPDTAGPIRAEPGAFPTVQGLAAQFEDEARRRQTEWARASDALRHDPSLLVYYPFQGAGPWSRALLDQSGGRRQPHDGVIVGCSWGAGRWPGRQGLEFKQVSDRVRFHVPGDFESLTLAAWVRVDALPNLNNSLMMTDGWATGAPHWQIGDGGMLVLGVKAPPGVRNAHYHAPGVFGPERLGRWTFLSVVYDRAGGQVTHYADGEPVAEVALLTDTPLRIGDAELGNWNTTSSRARTPIRFFTGCLDEFMMFSRALTEPEIERLYAQGRPPS